MPGWANSTNKFGPSNYVVGTVLGDGVTYTSIQAAINDAIAAGTNSVYIRPGLYIESLTIPNSIALIGATGENRGSAVFIQGQTTLVNGTISLNNLHFAPLGGDTPLSINVAGYVILSCCGCTMNSTGAITPAVHFAAGAAEATFNNCIMRPSTTAAILDDIGAFIVMEACFAYGGAGVAGIVTNASGYQYYIDSCVIDTVGAIHTSSGIGGFISRFSRFNNGPSGIEAFFLNNAVSILNLASCEVQCAAASGDWVTGIGTMSYSDVVLSSTAQNINGGVSVTEYGWRPYGSSGAAPGLGVTRGTACFDSTQFNVSDGFVQMNLNGLFPWNDIGISGPINSFNGYISTAAVTLTLPAVPAQGDVIKFKADSALNLVIQANIGQKIRVGNAITAIAGSIFSTAIGDAIELTYRAATATWIANSMIGNWTV